MKSTGLSLKGKGLLFNLFVYAFAFLTGLIPFFTVSNLLFSELLNFFGFMMMPTIVTYAGLIGAFFVVRDEREHTVIQAGLTVMALGILFEHLADKALHVFLSENTGKRITCREGIWKYSRHPNYLGEMMFWTGIFISYYAMYPDKWQWGLGFVLIIFVFIFASIPLMEAHNLSRREDYAEYMEETSVLIPMPPKTKTRNAT